MYTTCEQWQVAALAARAGFFATAIRLSDRRAPAALREDRQIDGGREVKPDRVALIGFAGGLYQRA